MNQAFSHTNCNTRSTRRHLMFLFSNINVAFGGCILDSFITAAKSDAFKGREQLTLLVAQGRQWQLVDDVLRGQPLIDVFYQQVFACSNKTNAQRQKRETEKKLFWNVHIFFKPRQFSPLRDSSDTVGIVPEKISSTFLKAYPSELTKTQFWFSWTQWTDGSNARSCACFENAMGLKREHEITVGNKHCWR